MGGSKITLQPGQAYRVADDATKPDSWTLANYAGGATIVGQVVIGDGRIDDNSIAGTVNVVDGGKFRTLANGAFAGSPGSSAVAGQYGRLQLWNPIGSGTRLIVESLVLRANAAANNVIIGFTTAQLAQGQANGISKMSGGAVGKGVTCSDTTATTWTVGLMPGMSGGSVAPSSMQNIFDIEPMIVTPGYGLTIWAAQLNADIVANLQWYEEPNV
jgi:hypothetical protein